MNAGAGLSTPQAAWTKAWSFLPQAPTKVHRPVPRAEADPRKVYSLVQPILSSLPRIASLSTPPNAAVQPGPQSMAIADPE